MSIIFYKPTKKYVLIAYTIDSE